MADEKTRNLFLQEVTKIDSQIMDLTSELVKQLQKAVDLDQELYGSISEITQKFLETYHYKVYNGIVVVEDYHVPENDAMTQNNTLTDGNKRIINQSQLDGLITEHREKQKAGNYEMLDLSNCKFENIEFTGDYSLVNFRGSEFNGCKFNNANIEDTILEKADIYKSDISSSVFENCIFKNGTFAYVKANDSTFRECQFAGAAYVASQLSFTKFYKCNWEQCIIHGTSFSHNVIQDCQGDDRIDVSENTEKYREEFYNTFYGNVFYLYDIEKAPTEHHYNVNIHTYIDDKEVASENVIVNYDLNSNTINIFENDISAKSALTMFGADLRKDIQKLEFEELFVSRPRVMVNRSASLMFHEGQMYDFSEFASRLAAENPENVSSWVDYTLTFEINNGDQNEPQSPEKGTFQDEIDVTEKGVDIVEHLAESKFFSPNEIEYLREHAKGIIDSQSQEQKQNQTQEINADANARHTADEKNTNKMIDRPYQAFAYVNSKETQKPVRVTGNTPEEIINMLQEWNRERTDDNQLAVCYIRPNNTDAKDFIKYDIKTGADITPIYLKLPPMGREKFMALVADIKSKGAKYNPTQKAFYVTKQNDLSLFSKYIPDASQTPPEPRTGSKSSVIDKLNNNKGKVNPENHTKQKQQHRSNEVPMIS